MARGGLGGRPPEDSTVPAATAGRRLARADGTRGSGGSPPGGQHRASATANRPGVVPEASTAQPGPAVTAGRRLASEGGWGGGGAPRGSRGQAPWLAQRRPPEATQCSSRQAGRSSLDQLEQRGLHLLDVRDLGEHELAVAHPRTRHDRPQPSIRSIGPCENDTSLILISGSRAPTGTGSPRAAGAGGWSARRWSSSTHHRHRDPDGARHHGHGTDPDPYRVHVAAHRRSSDAITAMNSTPG